MNRKRTLSRALALIILVTVLVPLAALCTEIMPPADSPLLEAVKSGDADEVQSILAALEARMRERGQGTVSTGPLPSSVSDEINEKGGFGHTPLATAARNGSLEIVKLLVEHGAAIDGEPGDQDMTPLMEASAHGHVEVAHYLIAKGADVNARRKGLTPLLMACDHFSVQFDPVGDKTKTAHLLLESGADVNVQDESWLESGITPLMFAAVQGNAALVQAILARGAHLDMKNSKGDTALSLAQKQGLEYISHLLEAAASAPDGTPQQAAALLEPLLNAIKQGRLDAAQDLVSQGANVNARTGSGSTPLMYAADTNRPDIAQLLLNNGADVNAKNGENNTALIYAATMGNLDVARVLLQNRADVNVRNMGGGDALIYAVMGTHADMVRLLLAGGAKIDERYDEGKTALIMAIEQGSFEIVEMLLAGGADANAQDEDQKTALIYACEQGDLVIVQALVAKGARIDAESKYGDTALETAISKKHVELARFFITSGADFKTTTALTSAVIAGSIELARLFRDNGADVNERSAGSRTPLMYAAAHDPGITEYLVTQGADVNAHDSDGNTALMAAVESFEDARLQTIKLLLASRADCTAANTRGETALILAAERGEPEIVQALLDNGSDAAAQDRQGKTAWAYAFQAGHTAVTALLERKGSPRAYNGVTWEGNSSLQKEAFITVVETPEAWAALWKCAFDKPAPDMEFERYAVACVFLGHAAPWLYDIEFGKPLERDNQLVIPYVLIDIMLRLSGPFKAGGQYRMTVFEKHRGLGMILEDDTDRMRQGI